MTTGASSASFVYDGNGLRQSETTGSGTTEFTWDPDASLPLLLSDGANSYIYGPGGTPIEQISSGGTPTYLLTDQLGSTRALTNSSGSVTATFTYDAWGNLAGSTGSATTPFMYAGAYYDSSTGLYYMRARWYDPGTGQFMSVDPDLAETGQPYAYAGDDPVNEVDPSGLVTVGYCGGAAAAFLGAKGFANGCLTRVVSGGPDEIGAVETTGGGGPKLIIGGGVQVAEQISNATSLKELTGPLRVLGGGRPGRRR